MKRDIEFLFEIWALKHVKRFGNLVGDAKMANVTEHTFRVMRIAWILAKEEKGCNIDKVLKLALIHDIAESRTGDTNGIQKRYTERNEEKALKEMLQDTVLSDEEIDLWLEAQERKTLEAQIMKDADYLDQRLEIHEKSHQGFSFTKDRKGIFEWMYNKLYTENARTLWKQIETTHPLARQTNIPNYYNS